MIPVFFGHEDRVEVGTTVFVSSLLRHARSPVMLCPMGRLGIPGIPEGSNAFTFRRFLSPYLMRYRGWAIFVDGSDMLCRADIGEMAEWCDDRYAVRVVRHDYATCHSRKYRGSSMEADNADYPRKQWASVMLIHCGHPAWQMVTPEYVASAAPLDLLQLRFLPDAVIGALPVEWNWLADEHGVNPDARLVHYTAGVPAFPSHSGVPMSELWHEELAQATRPPV